MFKLSFLPPDKAQAAYIFRLSDAHLLRNNTWQVIDLATYLHSTSHITDKYHFSFLNQQKWVQY